MDYLYNASGQFSISAKVTLKEGAGEKVSILGNHYSVAFYLSKS